jgi:hypothetical protein
MLNNIKNTLKLILKTKYVFGQSHDIEHGEDYFINFVALLAAICKIRVFD